MRLRQIILAGLFLFLAGPANAAFNVFACEPEWGALAAELGGGDVSVFTATTARQDPHQIEARPALIARLRNAELAICAGAELEIGWMPALLRQAANSRVQPGAPGNFAAAEQVRRLEIPTQIDRSMGDVHPSGNPHVHLDPRNLRMIAVALAQRMSQLDPAHAAGYAQRRDEFLQRWDAAIRRWEESATPLRGVKVAVYHSNWTYLFSWLGMAQVTTIEPKPGIAPGSAHLAQLLDDIPGKGARLILYTAYQNPQAPQYLSGRTGVPAVLLPFTVGGTEKASSLIGLFDDTIARLRDGLEKSNARP